MGENKWEQLQRGNSSAEQHVGTVEEVEIEREVVEADSEVEVTVEQEEDYSPPLPVVETASGSVHQS